MANTAIKPPKRTPFIDVVDTAIRAGRRIGMVDPAILTKQRLMESAVEETGLDDFGDRWFERPMDTLLDSVKG